MKRFGFLWNEIIQSWRDEDIICYAEQEKLEFNELPCILLKRNSLADLVGPYGTCPLLDTAVLTWFRYSGGVWTNYIGSVSSH